MATTKGPKDEFIQIRVTSALKKKLQQLARREGKTMTEMLVSSALDPQRKMDRAA